MGLDSYSESNISTSCAVYLADRLIEVGYLIYWQKTDAMQTATDWYNDWSTQFASYQADPAVQAQLVAAKGVVTLLSKATAKPVYPTRHTSDGSVSPDDEAQVPFLAIEVTGETPGRFLGIGDKVRYRNRDLLIYGAVRDDVEQSVIRDALVRWFDDTTFVPLLDYDSGTLAEFDKVELQFPLTDASIYALTPEASRYEVILTVRLQYEG